MSRPVPSILDDRELVQALAERPQLLAIADAIVATQTAGSRGHRGRYRIGPAMAAAAAVAAAVALLLAPPWSDAPTLAERALAAVGNAPVLHVAIEEAGEPLVEVDTGAIVPRTLRTEIWFDEERGLKRTVTTLDGRLLDELLETPQGSWARSGPVYTCAWIAAHPVEATRAGVSCAPDGENGTEPRRLPEPRPTLDPALAELADRYRSALASGAAREEERGRLDGREVVWLRFPDAGAFGRVAVDAETFMPVALEREAHGRPVRVVEANTLPRASGLFRRPETTPTQTGGGVVTAAEIDPAEAARALEGALWLGPEWNGLSLVSVERQERAVATGDQAERIPAVKLTYARVAQDGAPARSPRVELYEAERCIVRVGWRCSAHDPAEPGLLGAPFGLDGPLAIGLLRTGPVHVSIWAGDGAPDLLSIARALSPIPAGQR